MLETTHNVEFEYMSQMFEIELSPSLYMKDDILEELQGQYIENFPEPKVFLEDFEIHSILEAPKFFDTLEKIKSFYENIEEHLDLEVYEAADACDIQFCDISEAYQGKYNSDEDFAQDMAEQCGDLAKKPHWPYTCIDWERAANELMYDYCEDPGHYFRNL